MKSKSKDDSKRLVDTVIDFFMLRIQTAGVDKKTDIPKHGKSRQGKLPKDVSAICEQFFDRMYVKL